MRFKTWPVAALGLGSLLVLIAVSMLTSSRKAQEIYSQLDQLNTHHHDVDTKLRRLRSDVNLSGIFVRDYLLDVAREQAPEYRERLAEFRRTNMATVAELRAWLELARRSRFAASRHKLDEYWQTFEPLFDWTPAEKIFRSASFLRREVVPRREAVLAIAQEIEELNNANLADATRRGRRGGRRRFATTCAGCSGRQPAARLGRRADRRLPAAPARAALRRAASDRRGRRAPDARAVAAAGRHAGGRAEEPVARAARPRRAGAHCACGWSSAGSSARRPGVDARASARRSPNADSSWIRCSAPSAIWRSASGPACSTTSACSRRSSGTCAISPAGTAWTSSLTSHGDLDALPDRYRTCVYRAVQEALTNCVRHAQARIDHGERGRPRRSTGGVGDRRRHRPRSGAATQRPRSARHRGARQGTARDHDASRTAAGAGHDADDSPAAASRARWRSRLRVLLADDHGIVRRGLRSLLEEAGLSVVAEAADGLEAIRLVRGASAGSADSRHRHAED